MRYQAFEAVGVAHHPVDHVTAVAGAKSALAIFVNERVGALRVIQAIHQVDKGFAAPVAVDAVNKFLPISGRPARVDHDDNVATGSKQLGIPAIRPFVAPLSLRPAVDQELYRILFLRVEIRRLNEETLNFSSLGVGKPEGFHGLHRDLGEHGVIEVGEPNRCESALILASLTYRSIFFYAGRNNAV